MGKIAAEERLREILSKYVPESALEYASSLVIDYKPLLKITRSRSSKLGDYRSPHLGKPHQITINHDLNPFSFLITFVHEFAHMETWMAYKNKVAPHGPQWKLAFKKLMEPLMNSNVFPEDVLIELSRYMNNPAASSCADVSLLKVLRLYDTKESGPTIDALPEGAFFRLRNGMVMQKGIKLRKRFRCIEVNTKRMYLVSPVAEVEAV